MNRTDKAGRMVKKNKLKRYLLFLVGLFINALGVSLVTKASLGTSPISSIPYVLSLNFPLTLGNFTIIFSILLILLQILILRKNFKIENIKHLRIFSFSISNKNCKFLAFCIFYIANFTHLCYNIFML